MRCAIGSTIIDVSSLISSATSSSTSSGQINLASRLEIIRVGYQRQGFSNEVVRILLGGLRSSSQSAYQSSWVTWSNWWCIRFNFDPMSSSLNNILEFFTFLATNGKTYSTINVARSMLSSTLASVDGFQIGKHPLVTKLMDRIFNLNPPRPKYKSTWNVDLVLNYLRKIPENENLNLSQISHKLVTLLVLTTLLRVSEIASIDRQ
jgi:hypothetical protein